MVSDKNSQKEPLRKRKTPSRKRKGRMEEVWTPRLAAEGFTQVSNFFLDRYAELGLNSTEVLVLIHLIRYKWTKDDCPFPKYATLANRMGLHHRRVRAIVSSLERRGFLKRIERRRTNDRSDTNQYDLAPLFTRLEILMPESESESRS